MASFRKEFLSGTFYIAVAKYAGLVSQLLITAVLARLLTPADYGTVAIASVFVAFFNILSDIGIGVAVIQRKDLTREDLDHLFSINIYIGVILALLFFVSSGYISSYYGNSQLKPVCQLMCLLVLLSSARAVPVNLLYREKQFKYVAFTSLFVQFSTGIASVCAAFAGWGVYALVMSQVVSSFLLFVIFTLKYKRHFYLHIDLSPLKRIFSYSIYNFTGTLFCYFTLNIDKLLVGKFTGTDALGYYEKSYRLVFLPISHITFAVTPVLHPLLSECQDDYNSLVKKYLKLLEAFALISFPLSAICYFVSDELVLVFFGNQWYAAIPPFRIMSLAISFLLLDTTVGSVFNAANETKRGFYTMVVISLLMIGSVSMAIFYWNTIIAVAYAFLTAKIFGTLINFYSLMRGLKSSFSRFLIVLWRPMIIATCVFLLMLVLTQMLHIDNALTALVVKGLFGVVVSMISVHLFSGYNLVQLSRMAVVSFKKKQK